MTRETSSAVRPTAGLAVVLSLVLGLTATSAFAQSRPAASLEAELADPERRATIEVGMRLERSRQWRDAIDHYGESLSKYPDSRYLQYGLRRSKIHFGIDRRYSDASFVDEMSAVPAEDALELFEAVRDQVRTHFVEPISDTSLVAHGTESLWLALANHRFLDRNLFGVDPVALKRFRDRLRADYWNYDVTRGGGARATILDICRLAHQEVALDPSAVILEYVFGACNCLDDYSDVLTPGRLGDLFSNIDGEFVGIGIVMESKTGRGMKLINVLPASPAAEAGLRPGEWIIGVDGTDVRGMTTDESSGLLTGTSGSTVRLRVENRDGQVRSTACVRRRVEVKSVPIAQMVDRSAGIGYIRLSGFQKSTSREMTEAVRRLEREGMRKLIWDVRGNPGGVLDEAVEALDLFLDSGVLVSTRGRAFDQNMSHSARAGNDWSGEDWDGEIVLLIDGNSASASEIVAGCLRDHRRATIVGRKSYGKWSVQSIYPTLRDASGMELSTAGLKLTTARFYSPDGHNYGRRNSYDVVHGGLTPDVVVPQPDDEPIIPGFDAVDPADPDVAKAVDILRGNSRYSQR